MIRDKTEWEVGMTRGKAPFRLIFNNDTTNTLTCVSPWHEEGEAFREDMLVASIEELAGSGVDAYMLSPGMGWVPWWQSKVIPDHFKWWMDMTGLQPDRLVQLGSFGRRGRDPRARTVTVAFICVVGRDARPQAASDAAKVSWFRARVGGQGGAHVSRRGRPTQLAFDHGEIIGAALEELARRSALALGLLRVVPSSWAGAEVEALAKVAMAATR